MDSIDTSGMSDRRRHTPYEWWCLEATANDARIAVITEVLLDANARRGHFWFVAVSEGRVFAVVDNDIPYPERSLEVRTAGLWFEYRSQRDQELFTADLEAFGIGVDAGTVIGDGTYGDRVPVGCEIEWESERPSGALDSIEALVDGEVLIGERAFSLVGRGRRWHRWAESADVAAEFGSAERSSPLAVLSEPWLGPVAFGHDGTTWWRHNVPDGVTIR